MWNSACSQLSLGELRTRSPESFSVFWASEMDSQLRHQAFITQKRYLLIESEEFREKLRQCIEGPSW